MNKNKTAQKTIHFFLLVLVLGGAVYAGYKRTGEYLKLKEKELKHNAVTSCLESVGQHNYEDYRDKSSGNYPHRDIYMVCMKDKGYESTWDELLPIENQEL